MASQSVASTSNAAVNNDDAIREKSALVLRLFKKFPHLFKKTPKPNNPTVFSLGLSATPQKIEEAIQELELSGDHADMAGFKNLLTSYSQNDRETPLIPNVTPEAPSRISSDDYYARLVENILAHRNLDVTPPNAEETATEPPISGDDYGNRRKFEQLRKEELLANLGHRNTGIPPRVPEYNDKDIYELSSLEDMLKEFEKDDLL